LILLRTRLSLSIQLIKEYTSLSKLLLGQALTIPFNTSSYLDQQAVQAMEANKITITRAKICFPERV
jgi:hypothetical protein